MTVEATWPLTPEQRAVLERLSVLVRRFGAARFTAAHLVAASAQDFPEPWQPTLSALYAVIHRLCWHAHVDAEIAVRDLRVGAAPVEGRQLRTTELGLVAVDQGRATFELAAFGNDDIAGLLSHEIGWLFLELAPGDPFRGEAPAELTDADASLAACYLGLGVLVANSATYFRRASRWQGQFHVGEQQVARAGGLEVADAVLVLAVQDLLRDDHQPALATLHPLQTEWLEAWRTALDGHDDELRALLELDAHPGELPPRADAPRAAPADLVERDRQHFNQGRLTFRVPARSPVLSLGGLISGAIAGAVFLPAVWFAIPALAAAGGVVGIAGTRRHYRCSEPECGAIMKSELATCPRCGGTIAETIADASLRLERREALQRDE